MYRTGRGVGSLAACSSCEDSEAVDSGKWQRARMEGEERSQRRAASREETESRRSLNTDRLPASKTQQRAADGIRHRGHTQILRLKNTAIV